jgi:hypothetical protein
MLCGHDQPPAPRRGGLSGAAPGVRRPQATEPHSATWDEQGRVWVTDPDGWLLRYPAAALRRGTARAELVAHRE